jgi:FAD/FMN-containing dehydrogenase
MKENSMANLPVEFAGRRITSNDPDYEETRKGWNDIYQSRPAEILLCTNTADVVAALKYARASGLPFRIRSGGHAMDGNSSVDAGIVINLSSINSVELQPDGLVHLGPAARTVEIVDALRPYKRTIPGGACTNVGVGGYALGGGGGLVSRTYGLAAHNIVELEMVNADGEVLTLNEDNHPDLFWACRGAGNGNFGVVTKLVLRTYEVDTVAYFRVAWPWKHLETVYQRWQDWSSTVDARVNTFFTINSEAAGWVDVGGQFIGPQEEFEPLLQELLAGQPVPESGTVDTIPYPEAVQRIAHKVGTPQFHLRTRGTALNIFSPLLDDDGVRIFQEHHEVAFGNIWTWIWAGAGLNTGELSLPADALNIPASSPGKLSLNIRADWTNPVHDEKYLEWFRHINDALIPYTPATYQNWTSRHVEPRPYRHYGEHLPRLIEIKRRYDPEHLFEVEGGLPLNIRESDAKKWALSPPIIEGLRANGSLTTG